MGLDKVLELDVAYDNKAYGNLIDPYEWNTNFKKIEEITNKNAETINANLDSLTEETGAALIGSAPIESLGQTLPSTVGEQLRLLADQSLNVYNREDIDGMLSDLPTGVTFDETTGSFTVSFKNGNTTTINTNLEKIPATFELITNVDNTVYLRVTNEDGSYSDTDVSSLLNLYDFHSTECIEVENDGKNVTPRLKEGCITLLHLTDEAKQYIEDYANQAKADALSAQTAATSAQANADSVRSTLSDVTMKAAEVESHHIAVTDKMSTIEQNVLLSKSWATGGTGARLNEDFNNAKYWAEQAKQVAEDNVTLDVVAEKIGEGTITNAVDETGYLPISYSLSGVFKLARLQISTLTSHIKNLLTATDVKISDRLSTELGLANGNVEGALTILSSKSVTLPEGIVLSEDGEETTPLPLDADTLQGHLADEFVQKFEPCETVFNADGSITESNNKGTLQTVFNEDGSITEKYADDTGTVITKTTSFNEDGSISEVVN